MNGVAAGPSAPGGGRWRRAELEEQGALEESRALEELGAEALGALEEVGAGGLKGRWAELGEVGALEESRALEELGAEAWGTLEEVGAGGVKEYGCGARWRKAGLQPELFGCFKLLELREDFGAALRIDWGGKLRNCCWRSCCLKRCCWAALCWRSCCLNVPAGLSVVGGEGGEAEFALGN